MRHGLLLNFLWILAYSLTMHSCKEERVFPQVSIELPDEGSVYNYGDTIRVRVLVERADEGIIPNVLKGDQVVRFPYEIYDHTDNEYLLFFFYRDKYLESGNYDIRITTFNGENKSSDFREIRINEFPRRYRGLVAVSGSGTTRLISKVDSSGGVKTVGLSGDHTYVACSGSFNQVLTAPETSGQFLAFGFEELNSEYSLPNPRPQGAAQYRNVYAFGQRVYALLANDRVFNLNSAGGLESSFSLQDPFIAYCADGVSDERIVVSAKEETANDWRLFVLNPASGFVEKQAFTKPDVKGVSYAGNGHTFFTYPFNNQAVIADYNHQTGQVSEQYFIPDEVPVDILVRNGVGFLATEQKVYTFDPALPGMVTERFTFGVSSLAYDQVNAEVYMASGNTVYKTGLSTGGNVYVTGTTEKIHDIAVMYNK
ncbi:MAG: hypothetical protein RLP14_04730 [Owenweeksia sp.]